MEQAVFRCRPHNLNAPEQGDLFKGQEGRRRLSLDIHVFGQTPLGMPVHVVTERAARKPALLDQVVTAAKTLVKSGYSVTQRGLEAALREEGLPVTYRGVIEALRWLRREHGESWLDTLWVEESPPRAFVETETKIEEALLVLQEETGAVLSDLDRPAPRPIHHPGHHHQTHEKADPRLEVRGPPILQVNAIPA